MMMMDVQGMDGCEGTKSAALGFSLADVELVVGLPASDRLIFPEIFSEKALKWSVASRFCRSNCSRRCCSWRALARLGSVSAAWLSRRWITPVFVSTTSMAWAKVSRSTDCSRLAIDLRGRGGDGSSPVSADGDGD